MEFRVRVMRPCPSAILESTNPGEIRGKLYVPKLLQSDGDLDAIRCLSCVKSNVGTLGRHGGVCCVDKRQSSDTSRGIVVLHGRGGLYHEASICQSKVGSKEGQP